MALIDCPSCGKKMSDKAKTCPNCDFSYGEASVEDIERKENMKRFKKMHSIQNQSMLAMLVSRQCAVVRGTLLVADIFNFSSEALAGRRDELVCASAAIKLPEREEPTYSVDSRVRKVFAGYGELGVFASMLSRSSSSYRDCSSGVRALIEASLSSISAC